MWLDDFGCSRPLLYFDTRFGYVGYCRTAITLDLDACAPGLGFDQLRSSLLVGQTTNLTKDDPLSRAINFAVNSLDPNQPVTVKNLACEVFDNRCLWRTSNLSTVPWFQSNYKFDPNILKYATGTDIQPDGDYGISVVLSPNKTEYAV